jgi:uncharacterized membrane protein YcaP (DUF421 family)
MLFDSWQGLGRVLLVGALAYAGLVLLLRVSGNRTLSKLNAFDLVVTVALGSTLATVLLSKDVALVEGLLAFALLIGLQFLVTWGSVRSELFNRIVKTAPVLVLHRGAFLYAAMRRARVAEDEILAALRGQGVRDPSEVQGVVLESDGSLSVVPLGTSAPPTLGNVAVPQQQGEWTGSTTSRSSG